MEKNLVDATSPISRAEKKVEQALVELFEASGADSSAVFTQESIWEEIYDVIQENKNDK